MFDKKIFSIGKENFSEVTADIHKSLLTAKVTEKEVLRADLLIEETFMRLSEIGNTKTAKIEILQRFGDVSIKIEADGDEYNPLIEVTDFDEEDEDYFRTLILKANRDKMSFVRKNAKNIVIIQVHDSSSKQLYYTLIGMVAGIIFGLLMKEIFSQEIISAFDSNIVKNFRTMFLNALNMMIAPVIFFSVISGVTSISNAADVGRIGGKLISCYITTTLIASVLSIALACFMFSGDIPQLGTVENSNGGETQSFSAMKMLVGIIPKNLVDPIAQGNMIQILFVAIIFGICINKLGDKVNLIHDFISAMNSFCLRMIMMIVTFIPMIAFLAMSSLMFHVGLESIFLLGKLALGQLLCCMMMICVYALIILVVGKITPVPFLKKIPSFIPIPLSTSSSNASMPFTMKFCTEKLGISPKLSSFSIPIGATVNMDGGCIYLSIASIMLAKMYGMDLTPEVLVTIFMTVVALSVGAPGVPGSAIVCLASVVAELGLPVDATAIILGIDPLCSLFRASLNSVSDIAMTSVLAKTENLMDENIYLKL